MTSLLVGSATVLLLSTFIYLLYSQRRHSPVQHSTPLQLNVPVITTRFSPYPSYLTIPLPPLIFKPQCKEKYALRLSRLSPYPLHVHARQVHGPSTPLPAPALISWDQDVEVLFIDCTDDSQSFVQIWVTLAGDPTHPVTWYKHGKEQSSGPIAAMYGKEPVQIGVRLDRLLFGLVPQCSVMLIASLLIVVLLYLGLGISLQSRILQSCLSSHHRE